MADPDFGIFNQQKDRMSREHSNEEAASKSAQFLIRCQDLGFSCSIEKFTKDSTPCTWFEIGGARLNTYDSSGELSGDGRMFAKDALVCMKYGSWGPLIQQAMYNGKTILKIDILRLASVETCTEILQELNFENCLIKIYEQSAESIFFAFSFAILRDISNKYNQDSTLSGAIAAEINYPAMTVKC